jgi:alkanesulfonate monooxygenase SsuD/methylene tetrahydromethanopterin reductase-like flavin-dependent oxidoreductase (luciferase family)
MAIAHDQWRSNVFPPPLCWDLDTTKSFDQASTHVTPEAVGEAVRVSSDLGQHAAWLAEYADLGFDQIYLHHVGKEQRPFLDAFGEHVLPQLDVRPPAPAVAVHPRRPEQPPQPAVLP